MVGKPLILRWNWKWPVCEMSKERVQTIEKPCVNHRNFPVLFPLSKPVCEMSKLQVFVCEMSKVLDSVGEISNVDG